jgi:DNA-binding GntR family transcriptional regulator
MFHSFVRQDFVRSRQVRIGELQRFPLRVVVYEQIAEAVRDGTFRVGSQLPSEPDLCEALGVSRPVLREALVLLEEDGLLVLRRGVGRFVATDRPTTGLKRLLPMERLLAVAAERQVDVRRVRAVHEEASDFTRQQLRLEGETVWFWESVVSVDDEPVCLTQEWCADRDLLDDVHSQLHDRLVRAEWSPSTMLAALLGQAGVGQLSAEATVSATVLGAGRAELLPVQADAPLLQVRQRVTADADTPLMVAKHLLAPAAPPLTVTQLT